MDDKQEITGNNNIQVGRDYIVTTKVVKKNVIIPDYTIHISVQQAYAISNKIKEIASKNPSKNFYSKLYNLLKERYKVDSYKLIPKEYFDDAREYLSKYNASVIRKTLKNIDNKTYRKEQYKAIHAKANELHIDHDELYAIINSYLNHKEQYKSLTELSDTALHKIYLYFINK